MTKKVRTGLEFSVVALPGVGPMPAAGEDEQEAAGVFYVAATRATQRLVIGVDGDGGRGWLKLVSCLQRADLCLQRSDFQIAREKAMFSTYVESET